jgi:hypothetical protein
MVPNDNILRASGLSTMPLAGKMISVAVLAVLLALQIRYAAIADLRSDEAYYWTWSKERVLSFLDHPPMIAWFIRFGTAIFGDTNFGARFGGMIAIWIAQGLLADIVWRQTRNLSAVVLVILMPFAALEFGVFGSRIVPDVAMIPFSVGMLWALVRLAESGDGRWWLAAGCFGGLALLSKYTAVLFLPAIAAFALVPNWRMRWMSSPYPWFGMLIAIFIFSPVVYWNWLNDWASFRFQFVRVGVDHGFSARTIGDFLGLQAVLVGPILFPVALVGSIMLAWRGYSLRNPVFILLSSCALVPFAFFLWRSLSLRVGDTWPMLIWPFAFAATAINFAELQKTRQTSWMLRSAGRWAVAAIALGAVLNVGAFYYYAVSDYPGVGGRDPIGSEEGYREVALRAKRATDDTGATWIATLDYRVYAMLRWHLKDSIPVIQVNERSRFLGFNEKNDAIRSGTGLYVDMAPGNGNAIETLTPAKIQYVGSVDRTWRGVVLDTFLFKKTMNWVPDLSPPPDSVFYKWRFLG